MNWITKPSQDRNIKYQKLALEHQSQLTKPPGSLGRLEDISVRLSDLQQTLKPSSDNICITIFAGDHGVAEEGVSAFPQEVTAQMIMNFLQGGAAISVLADYLQASLEVVDCGILIQLPKHENLIQASVGKGTANSAKQEAMTLPQLNKALQVGYDSVERAFKNKADIFIGGEMGIANTTSASVLYCALLGLSADEATGAGTGLDEKGIKHKVKIVQSILNKHHACGTDALAWLRCVGGYEIVALTGAYIHAAQVGIPVLVDGFISSVAALCAVRVNPKVNDYLIFSHVSAEQGHSRVLTELNQTPLLDLGMRLGEGSGAAVAVPIIRAACATHNKMATFAEAMVATKN